MTIEEEIKQTKPFADEYQRAGVNLMFTTHWLESESQSALKKEGLTLKQFNILRILRGAKNKLSTCDIGSRMIDRMSDISRIVDRMIKKDLVTKCTNQEDKRLVDIGISEKGLDLLARIDAKGNHLKSILEKLSEEEAKQLNQILDKIRN